MLNNFKNNFSDLLRIKGISQKGLANKLSVTPATVNQWAKGKREPSFDNLLLICSLLDISPSELLGYKKRSETETIGIAILLNTGINNS